MNLVLVDVTVTDPKGTIVGGLRANDFELMDDGIPQEIVHVSQDEIPLAIALVIDVSGSMASVMKPMQNALVRALPALKAEDRVALFAFSDTCRYVLGLTSDFRSIAKRIGELYVDGPTNINDAVYEPANYLHRYVPRGRRVIILFSDTLSYTDGLLFTPPKQVERTLLQSEVALFGIRQGPRPFNLDEPRQVDVDQLADESGGFIVNVLQPEGFQSAFESLIHILKTRYTLGFYPNSTGKPNSIRRLTVRLKNTDVQAALPGAMLRYRTQYRVPTEKKEKSR